MKKLSGIQAIKTLKKEFTGLKRQEIIKAAKGEFKAGHYYSPKEQKDFIKEHRKIFGSSVEGHSIAGKTAKEVAASVFGDKTDVISEKEQFFAERARKLEAKEKKMEALQAQTAKEEKIFESRKGDIIKAGQESAALAEADIAQRSGKSAVPAANGAAKSPEKANREALVPFRLPSHHPVNDNAQNVVPLVPRQVSPSSGRLLGSEDAPKSRAEAEGLAKEKPLEPGDPSKAIEMAI
jgi:hypothetical protein